MRTNFARGVSIARYATRSLSASAIAAARPPIRVDRRPPGPRRHKSKSLPCAARLAASNTPSSGAHSACRHVSRRRGRLRPLAAARGGAYALDRTERCKHRVRCQRIVLSALRVACLHLSTDVRRFAADCCCPCAVAVRIACAERASAAARDAYIALTRQIPELGISAPSAARPPCWPAPAAAPAASVLSR